MSTNLSSFFLGFSLSSFFREKILRIPCKNLVICSQSPQLHTLIFSISNNYLYMLHHWSVDPSECLFRFSVRVFWFLSRLLETDGRISRGVRFYMRVRTVQLGRESEWSTADEPNSTEPIGGRPRSFIASVDFIQSIRSAERAPWSYTPTRDCFVRTDMRCSACLGSMWMVRVCTLCCVYCVRSQSCALAVWVYVNIRTSIRIRIDKTRHTYI